jgi:hypothetical protein
MGTTGMQSNVPLVVSGCPLLGPMFRGILREPANGKWFKIKTQKSIFLYLILRGSSVSLVTVL